MIHLTDQEVLIAIAALFIGISIGWLIYIARKALANLETMFCPTTRDQGTEIDYDR